MIERELSMSIFLFRQHVEYCYANSSVNSSSASSESKSDDLVFSFTGFDARVVAAFAQHLSDDPPPAYAMPEVRIRCRLSFRFVVSFVHLPRVESCVTCCLVVWLLL
jgi:hypothetical protein